MTDTDDDKRYIVLDPDIIGADLGWVYIIVAAPTGVVYQNQGGGHGCIQHQQEGYLVPLLGRDADGDLRGIFVGELESQGSRRLEWPADLLDRLRAAVAFFYAYGSANRDDLHPAQLTLDESRLPEADEGWVPVLTPDGPGVLVWENSD